MRHSSLLALALALLVSPLQAQRTHVVHRTPGDSTENSYRVFEPAGPARALLVLLPGYGGDVDSFSTAGFTPSTLPQRLASAGILTVVAVPVSQTLYAGEQALGVLDSIVQEVRLRHGIRPDRVAIGGFSAGGTGAVRYGQRCAESRCAGASRLAAVFAVDAPLDFERLWVGEAMSIRRASPRTFTDEARMILDELRRDLGGSPAEARDAYLRHSPFIASEPDGGNARHLVATPIRLYVEPDVEWWIRHRALDYQAMNAMDHAGLVNVLQIAGNREATLITTSGQGIRPNGMRHPHSWSIVDEAELAPWLLQRLIPAAP